ncbi:hypothetical protein B296_00009667 [Ensete ventricosum]|uniref:Glycosyltransferase 2-like domain-containing protein n=1 Tax=Ensete ventricosum TaxID=4639 RepID=A0A426ZIT1_ENSVE|nr:hypothetical protein B296_00009667 [Ensete ventricosum]
MYNSRIALVQARWDFERGHGFQVLQSITIFTLTGTAGVWRISAINAVGGWKDRTTVEDMDLAVRASLKGWKFLYVGDIKVLKFAVIHDNIQQRRSSVISYIDRSYFPETCLFVLEQEVSLLKKIHVIYSFFFVRRVVAPIVTFAFYCIVIPVSVVVPEVSIPIWGVVYIPTTITILNAIRNPRYRSLPMIISLDQNFLP